MGRIQVRRGRRGDLDRIVAIETAVFDADRLSRASLSRYLTAPSAALLVVVADGVVAGYGLIGLRRGGRRASLYSIAVDPAFGRRGLGRMLLQALERRARAAGREALTLEVRVDNAAAVALYERLGYRQFDVVVDYYEDGAAALRMIRDLQPARAMRNAHGGRRARPAPGGRVDG